MMPYARTFICRVSCEGLHCSVPMDARIALAGTVVDLLPEAYKEKGPWIRKAPLKLIFPGARDPYAEEAVIFFPDTAAEKEQWCAPCLPRCTTLVPRTTSLRQCLVHVACTASKVPDGPECISARRLGAVPNAPFCRFLALSWAAKYDQLLALDPEHATVAAGLEAQRQYARFSRHIRSTAPVMLPTALPPSAATLTATGKGFPPGTSSFGTSSVGAGAGSRRRTWWGGRRRLRGAPLGGSPPMQPPTVPRQKPQHNRSQVVGDFIRDKQWGSQPMKQGLKPGEGSVSRVKGTLSVSKRSSSAQNLVAMAASVTPAMPVIPPPTAGESSPDRMYHCANGSCPQDGHLCKHLLGVSS